MRYLRKHWIFLNFLNGKDSGLNIRIQHTSNNEYKFLIETKLDTEDKNHIKRGTYLNNLFINAGLEKQDSPLVEWGFSGSNSSEFSKKIRESKKFIFDNFSLEPPTSEQEVYTYSFNAHARFKKNEFGNTIEGKKKFDEWLNEEKRKFNESIKEKPKKEIETLTNKDVQKSNSLKKGLEKTHKALREDDDYER